MREGLDGMDGMDGWVDLFWPVVRFFTWWIVRLDETTLSWEAHMQAGSGCFFVVRHALRACEERFWRWAGRMQKR